MINHTGWNRIGNESIPRHALIWVWESVYQRPCLAKWDGDKWVEPDRAIRDPQGFQPTHWHHLIVPGAPRY